MQAQKSKEKKIRSGYCDEGARTPSEPFRSTLKQGTKPTYAHIGSSRGGPAFVNCVPSLWKGQSTLEDEDTVEYVMGQNWRGMFRA